MEQKEPVSLTKEQLGLLVLIKEGEQEAESAKEFVRMLMKEQQGEVVLTRESVHGYEEQEESGKGWDSTVEDLLVPGKT